MSNKNNEVMKQQNDVNNRYSEFENRPKFNWSILVFVILGLIGVVLFAPISDKRSYSDTTQVRLMDAVLVEFEWTAEYSLPITTKPQERARYERLVRQIMNQGINEAVRGCFNSADLYAANTDTIYNSLYVLADFEPLEPKLDTLYITSMQFEAQFMEMIRALHDQKMQVIAAQQRMITDSLAFEAHQIRAQQKLEAMELDWHADSLSMAQREARIEHEKRIAEAKAVVKKINDDGKN